MNVISSLRARIKIFGKTEIGVDEFNRLQTEWITRVGADDLIAAERAVSDRLLTSLKEVRASLNTWLIHYGVPKATKPVVETADALIAEVEALRGQEPDANCITTPDGGCVGGLAAGKEPCMHDPLTVPQGWPTDEMLEAGAAMFESTLHSAADFKHHAFHVFNAMIAVAPSERDAVIRQAIDDEKQNEWKRTLIDALVVGGIFTKEHENNPTYALSELIAWENHIALTPEVSGAAVSLVKQTQYETVRWVIDEWEKPCGLTNGLSFIDRLRNMEKGLK